MAQFWHWLKRAGLGWAIKVNKSTIFLSKLSAYSIKLLIFDVELLMLFLQCDVFLSHPRSGILMAFRVLGLDPVRAAINPEGVAAHLVPSRFQSRLLMTKSELLMITNLEKVSCMLNQTK